MAKNLFFLCILFCTSCSTQQQNFARPQNPTERAKYEATGKKYMIATQGQAASEAAQAIFAAGGNIIDAAVAASFVISVERPQSTGIGGGGFLLYREAKTGKIYVLDFRERAANHAA